MALSYRAIITTKKKHTQRPHLKNSSVLLLFSRRQEHYDVSEALSCVLHSSIALHKDMEARPLSLEKCLDTFTAQEDIKEVRERGRRL